jgi:hypothetical protein
MTGFCNSGEITLIEKEIFLRNIRQFNSLEFLTQNFIAFEIH